LIKETDSFEEKLLRRIPKEIILLSFVFAIISAFIFSIETAPFVLAGGILSALGFYWLKQSVTEFLLKNKKKTLKSTILLYCLRLILILIVFFIIILFFSTKIIAFVAGFSTMIIVFLVEAVSAISKIKEWKT
jgi:hypothetical protein